MFFVISIENEDSRKELFYVTENIHSLSIPECRRIWGAGEEYSLPKLFKSRIEAEASCRQHFGEVVKPAPSWVFPNELDIAIKLLDLASKISLLLLKE